MIDERRSQIAPPTPGQIAQLVSNFHEGVITAIPAGDSVSYYREFNASGRRDVAAATGKYFILSLDGRLLLTDGRMVEQLSCSWEEQRASTDLVIALPIRWGQVPIDGRVVTQ